MVKIHGDWCGPNWTGGRKLSAEDYAKRGYSWDAPCQDALDCACRTHDRACSHPKGCSKKADTALIKSAEKLQLPGHVTLRMELALLNPLLAKKKRKDYKKKLQLDKNADRIIDAIALARLTRRH